MAPASPTVFGIPTPRYARSRTQSISSDRPSTVSHSHSLGLVSPPSSVSPEPEFIAASAAAQIVTHDHDNHAGTWYDQNGIEPPSEPAVVTSDALQLVNAFLDQLLFNFLQVSRSTNLSALRPAVSEILKPKLAKDTISNADEELREYLGSGDEDDYSPPSDPKSFRDWDVELAWKRTRLRCMVYSSLGDMEEEDEDLYMEQENLEIGAHEQASDVISPATAIFLTSVLEYMGELTLTVAGQVSYSRVRSKIEKDIKDGTRRSSNVADAIVVGEMDVERVALDRTLGRLWRGWKKRMRHPGGDFASHPLPADLMASPRRDSQAMEAPTASDSGSEPRKLQVPAGRAAQHGHEPSRIPLPLGDNDVDEIEVPGLACYSDDGLDDKTANESKARRRPKSLTIKLPAVINGLPTPTMSQPQTPMVPSRKRANSLPTPAASPFYAPKKAMKVGQPTDALGIAGHEPKPSTPGAKDPSRSLLTPAGSSAPAATAASPGNRRPGASSTAALSTASAAAAAARPRHNALSSRDDEDDLVTYETAEIVTSSRVSVAGSSASASESGKASTIKRSSSVHSARIVEVTGPRSPAHSRHTLVDATDRTRRISPSGFMNSPRVTAAEADSRAKAIERDAELSGYASTSPAPMERRKQSKPTPVSISESDEDYHRRPNALGPSRTPGLAKAAPIIPSVESPTSRTKKEQTAAGSAGKTSPLNRREHGVTNVKISSTKILNVSTGPFRDDTIPEVPQKAAGHSGRHSPKSDGQGMTPTERSKPQEADEELALSTQNNVTPRQIHTSASSASSGTSRLKPVRASEDNSSRAESVARNFEELIQSNQTITYTLTPENMRDIDVSSPILLQQQDDVRGPRLTSVQSKRSLDSPVVTKFSRKSEEARGQQTPRSSPTATEAPRSPLSHHPVSPSSPRTGERKSVKSPGPVPRVPAGTAVSTGRGGGPEARDARTYGESTADFAEFIKYTGPAGERGPPQPQVKTPTSPVKSSMDFPPVLPALGRERYQPRDAAVDNRGDSSDLIDFIRQGPPIAASSHRIPRHVAPFRSTMDSDQLTGAVGGMAVDATIPEIRYSQGSTNMTENSMPSIQSSINSNSALLHNTGAPGPIAGFDDEAPMPKRKQRRVRDPYAIDLSDEEDEDEGFAETPRPPARKEESLAEFLRNYEPPPEPPSEPPRAPRKKSSAPSLIGRFTRSGNRENKDSNGPSGPARNVPPKPDSPAFSSRATGKGGYIPIQVNMPPGYDKYGSTDNSQISRSRMASTTPSAGRVPMKKFEPRDAVVSKSQTSDLAAFLRDSAPPPDLAPRGPARRASTSRNLSRQDDGNGISKMFGRKKKASAT